jgi:hypothetical protein
VKTKILFFLLTGCLLALTAWLTHVQNPAQADEIPEKYRDTVSKGLEFLAKNQHKDGHWEGDDGKHPVAMTGLVGLALLMEKNVPSSGRIRQDRMTPGKHTANVGKAVDWLLARSQPGRDGLIFSEHPSETARYMEGHGLATLFLAGALEDETERERRQKLSDVLTRAVKYIEKAQSTQGGWYHTSKVEGHDFDVISATAIQIQALQAAENAGIPVRPGIVEDGQTYLRTAIRKYEDAGAKQSARRPADTAAALASRFGMRRSHISKEDNELYQKWLEYCQKEFPTADKIQLGRDELASCYLAQAMFRDGTAWKNYRTPLFDRLQNGQNKDGSWPAGDGIGVGSVYSTALWCIVLQLDKDSHPSRERVLETLPEKHIADSNGSRG